MTSNLRQIGILWLFFNSVAQINPYAKFQLNISTNGWLFIFLWSQILEGTFCNFVAMAPA